MPYSILSHGKVARKMEIVGTTPITLSGDQISDDALALDSLVEQVAEPPAPGQTMGTTPTEPPKPETTLITGTYTVPAGTVVEPILMLPADRHRHTVTLSIYSSAALSGVVLIGGDKGRMYFSSSAFIMLPYQPLTLEGYTGPVYIVNTIAEATDITVSFVAVTL